MRLGVVRALAAAVLFGATAPIAARLAGSLPTFTLAGLLYLGAAAAAAPMSVRRPPTLGALRAGWRPSAIAVLAGGAIGPLLLIAGLGRTNAATASLLLNVELPATVVLASVVFREHIGRRLAVGALLVSVASVVQAWQPGAVFDIGSLLIVAACVAWAIDNGVTAGIVALAPEHVVFLKGVIAGGANLAIGLTMSGWGERTGVMQVLAALGVGAAGYGWSIMLWVKGARELGSARAQAIFATAPFIGAAIAWAAFDAPRTSTQVAAGALAAVGVVVSLRTEHEHAHVHPALSHAHEHDHRDAHHGHRHDEPIAGRHVHPHDHEHVVHAHRHVPDLHHRHGH